LLQVYGAVIQVVNNWSILWVVDSRLFVGIHIESWLSIDFVV